MYLVQDHQRESDLFLTGTSRTTFNAGRTRDVAKYAEVEIAKGRMKVRWKVNSSQVFCTRSCLDFIHY